MNILTREETGLDPPCRETYRMRFPVSEVWLHHSVTEPTDDFARDWRGIQDIAFGKGWSDIAYSYGIHPSGAVMVGRGDHIGAHTEGRNSKSLGIVLIGNYETRVPKPEQVNSFRQLIHELEVTGRLVPAPEYPTGGHRDAPGASTACPGKNIESILAEFRVPWAELPPAPGVLVPVAPGAPPISSAAFSGLLIDPQGRGYWQVMEDGGIFTFSREGHNLPFHGSMGGTRMNAPIISGAVTPDGGGYWLAGADGGVFNFGNAPFFGGRGGEAENAPTTAIVAAPDGQGYWLLTTDGGIFAFGPGAFFAGRGQFNG